MSGGERLQAMPPEERRAFCRQVLESLSDLVEGEASDELCARVDELLGDCRSFLAFRDTFAATLRATRRLAEPQAPSPGEEETFQRCVARVRSALAAPPA